MPAETGQSESSAVDRVIRSALFRTGLPIARRAEVAAELRMHLADAIRRQRDGGLSGTSAVQAAVADFGDPRLIRRQLRRGQHHADRIAALHELRHRLAWALAPGAILAALQGALLSGSPLSTRLAVAASMFLYLGAGLCIPALYVLVLYRIRAQRPRPRDEFSLRRTLLGWAVVLAASLCTITAVSTLLYAGGSAVWDSSPFAEFFRNLIRFSSPDWWRTLARQCLLAAPLILATSLALASYQRCRCVDLK